MTLINTQFNYFLIMKISALILLVCFFCTSVFATNSVFEKKEKPATQELSISSIIEEIFDNKTEISNTFPNKKLKIIIMDNDFKKIKEESFEKIEDIYNQSTLVPIIYQSEFITKIHNVSYYILQKK